MRSLPVFIALFAPLLPLAAGEATLPRAQAPFAVTAPVVDGRADDPAWEKAPPVFFPAKNSDAALQLSCEVRFLWTHAGVYVAFRTTDRSPVYGHSRPGEPLYLEDVFEVFIDQGGDHRQFYEIQIDPAGQAYFRNNLLTAPPRLTEEGRLTPEFCERELWRWDLPAPEGFEVASRLDAETGLWTAEIFFPAAFVNRRGGGGPMKPASWRINLVRHDWSEPKNVPERKAAFLYWAEVLPGHPHLSPTRMGWLEFSPENATGGSDADAGD